MQRATSNPILTRADIPPLDGARDVSSVFNPGAVLFDGRYLLLLRIQTRGRETIMAVAESLDGEHFTVQRAPLHIDGLQQIKEPVYHFYDPRITCIEGAYYITLAADTDIYCRQAIIRTDDFERFELVAYDDTQDTRNGVLFPERRGGRYLRYDRPNQQGQPGDPPSGAAIVLSSSADLRSWQREAVVLAGRYHYWDEFIGAGPPPLKTRAGWLLIYHGVATHFQSVNIYQAGVALFDLDDPSRLLARSRENILEPRELYELTGQVPNVVFPSGLIAEGLDDAGYAEPYSVVRVYYGAADTCVGLATTTVGELLDACEPDSALKLLQSE